jgi:riboflavin kinase
METRNLSMIYCSRLSISSLLLFLGGTGISCITAAAFVGSLGDVGHSNPFVLEQSRSNGVFRQRSGVFHEIVCKAHLSPKKLLKRHCQMSRASENELISETQNTTALPMIDTNVSTYLFSSNQILRFRGVVETGYGRGGKKLGVPTANLGPSTVFDLALTNLSTGVYLGYAVLEGDSDTLIHKAVVNIGYSPTFVGQENAVKIIEAHLIEDSPIPDFYQRTMRLQLVGFMRCEMKFSSFPDLIIQILYDVRTANYLLGLEKFSVFRSDPFLTLPLSQPWVGTSGGNVTASWEFQVLPSAQ